MSISWRIYLSRKGSKIVGKKIKGGQIDRATGLSYMLHKHRDSSKATRHMNCSLLRGCDSDVRLIVYEPASKATRHMSLPVFIYCSICVFHVFSSTFFGGSYNFLYCLVEVSIFRVRKAEKSEVNLILIYVNFETQLVAGMGF